MVICKVLVINCSKFLAWCVLREDENLDEQNVE